MGDGMMENMSEDMKQKQEGDEAIQPETEVAEQKLETATEASVDTDEPEDDLASISAERDTYKEKYFYLAAEMQNMQKRFDKEKEGLLKFGSEKIMNDLVAVVDNFERTLGFIAEDDDEKIKSIAEGISMVNKLFLETLEKHGLKRIDALGKEFDPNFHEALAQQPAEGKNDMEVIQVYENGYTLNDRVVRAAKVIVVKN
jgi:molecular chaperone GrpE